MRASCPTAWSVAVGLFFLAAGTACRVQRAQPTGWLGVGDAAPPLSVTRWIKGEPVTAFQSGRVYVVEFWATWCPPCRASMPHLAELQQRFGQQVTFIGITDEDEATVRSFLGQIQDPATRKTWDQVVTYSLALDTDQTTYAAYMRAAGQRGIPTAFLIGPDGRVAWIGHPMELETPLKRILAATTRRSRA